MCENSSLTKLQISFVLLATLFASTTRAESLPDDCTILPASQGPALIRQCSRGAPSDVSGFWNPTAAQVNEIEKRLPGFVRQSGHDVFSGSLRQYIGFTSRNKKFIYLNAFPKSALEIKHPTNWKTAVFTVCDGGDHFWGVEFDPSTKTFHNLEFNGEA
jgi:hypothetical protein